MKNRNIIPLALIGLLIVAGVGMTFTGTWFPKAESPLAYGYSPETYQLQESYDRSLETLNNATTARISAEQALGESLKTESSARQSQCAIQLALGNSKLKDVGDLDPEETRRLQMSVQEASVCLITNTPAFQQ